MRVRLVEDAAVGDAEGLPATAEPFAHHEKSSPMKSTSSRSRAAGEAASSRRWIHRRAPGELAVGDPELSHQHLGAQALSSARAEHLSIPTTSAGGTIVSGRSTSEARRSAAKEIVDPGGVAGIDGQMNVRRRAYRSDTSPARASRAR